MKFIVGNRVVAIKTVDGWDLKGKRGKVIIIRHIRITSERWFDGMGIGVEFDEYIGGHDCEGRGKMGHCRYGRFEDFRLVGVSNPNCKNIILAE